MLRFLAIRHLAVIDQLELEFDPRLTVLTGETGAGKSILVDALALALGDRADASAIRQGAERAEISVTFDVPAEHAAHAWLRERELQSDDDSCTLRRVVARDGRSRGFINGQPVSLQDLKSLGGLLVDFEQELAFRWGTLGLERHRGNIMQFRTHSVRRSHRRPVLRSL